MSEGEKDITVVPGGRFKLMLGSKTNRSRLITRRWSPSIHEPPVRADLDPAPPINRHLLVDDESQAVVSPTGRSAPS